MTITTGKGTAILKFIVLALACSLAIVAHAADDKAKEQQQVRKMAQDTLQRLYKAEPKAKGAVEGAAGYAVFSNTGLKISHAWIRQGRGHRREQQEQGGDVHEGGGAPGRPRFWGEEI